MFCFIDQEEMNGVTGIANVICRYVESTKPLHLNNINKGI